jgi:hypothetical protein
VQKLAIFLAAGAAMAVLGVQAANWPQAAGPNGTWAVADKNAPVEWSVALGKNVLWRTKLPNGGQSGIAVWGNRLFLTTFEPWKKGQRPFSGVILGALSGCEVGEVAVECSSGGADAEPDDVQL